MMQAHTPTHCYDVLTQCMSPLHPLAQLEVWARCSGPLVIQKHLFELEVCGVK